jgi:tetratricopeptide (TPR) repeat protein
MRFIWIALACLSYTLAWEMVPRIDHTRHERTFDTTLLFPPDGSQLKHAATGFEEPLADLLWVRTVLVFGERYDSAQGEQWVIWLRKMLLASTTLDPTWRTSYFYGGVMLRVIGDLEGSDMIFTKAVENRPDDWFFPFSLGMNAYLYHKDKPTAIQWIEKAALIPTAPSWYAAAAAAMRVELEGNKAGIEYLKGILESTSDPAIRKHTELQLRRLIHDELVSTWDAACREYLKTTGRPLATPEDIKKLGFELPANPRQDEWIVGKDGVVRSKGANLELMHDKIQAEMTLLLP